MASAVSVSARLRAVVAALVGCWLLLCVATSVVAGSNDDTSWFMGQLDQAHDRWSQRVVDLSRGLDRSLDPSVDYPVEAYDSLLRLRFRTTLREGSQTIGASIDGSLSLPGARDRLQLVFDGVDPTDPSWFRQGALGAERAQGQRIGVDLIRPLRRFESDIGLRVRSGRPVDLLKRARIWRAYTVGNWDVQPRVRVFHADSIGLGYGPDLSMRYPLGATTLLLSDTSAYYYDRENRVRYAQSLRVLQQLPANRSLVWEVGVEASSRPTHAMIAQFAQVAFRSQLNRDWLVMELRPQVRRQREDDFSPEARLFLGLEVLLGNPRAD